jgi:hypothetical protein
LSNFCAYPALALVSRDLKVDDRFLAIGRNPIRPTLGLGGSRASGPQNNGGVPGIKNAVLHSTKTRCLKAFLYRLFASSRS